jgi:tetratricopeptide (TPR) repeat protein
VPRVPQRNTRSGSARHPFGVAPEIPEPINHEHALIALETKISRLGDVATSRDRRALSEALLQRAFTLQTVGRVEEAVDAYGELANRFVGVPEEAIRRDVVRALQQRGHLLRVLGRDLEAQASLDEAVAAGTKLARPSVEQMQADLERASDLERDGRYGEALDVLGDIIRPWGHAPADDAAELVAYATVLSAQTGVSAGPNIEAALQTCEEVVEHYGGSADAGVRAMVVWALTTAGWVYACAKRYDEAAASCARAIDYAGDNDDARIRDRTEDAREQVQRWRAAGSEVAT